MAARSRKESAASQPRWVTGYPRFQAKVGRRIRYLRRVQDLTLEEAAGRVDMDFRAWQRAEAGQHNLTLRTLYRIAHGLDVDIKELFEEPPGRR